MRYTIDTPSKKIVRLAVWKRVKELMGAERFYSGIHVVLLSAKAGDVSTLLGLGVRPHNIVGVDIDKHAWAAAKHKYPDVRCMHMDVIDAMKRLKGDSIRSVFLDYCAPFREGTVDSVVEASQLVSYGGVVASAFKIGREVGSYAQAIAEEKPNTDVNRSFYLRTDMLSRELLLQAKEKKLPRVLWPKDFYRYTHVPDTGDTPKSMLVCVATVTRSGQFVETPQATAAKIGRGAHYSIVSATHRDIGPLASLLAERDEDAHLLLNLNQESIPAFKAHRTRGTYEEAKQPIRRQRRVQ